MEKRYKVEDATVEEQEAFKKGMDELLNGLSLGLSLSINKRAVGIKLENGKVENVFYDEPILLVQKKVEVAETEIVSPIQADELNKKD